MHTVFEDRRAAGKRLAEALIYYRRDPSVVVLGLPRGGIPVAYEVACALDAPLDVFVVRKLGMPGHEEYAVGALASGDVRVWNPDALRRIEADSPSMLAVIERERAELKRRERLYRGDRPATTLRGRAAIVVDDGLATGSTMRAAVLALRKHRPKEIIVAVPVASAEACQALAESADRVLCLETPQEFRAVGEWYAHFEQTEDAEVEELLGNNRLPPTSRRRTVELHR